MRSNLLGRDSARIMAGIFITVSLKNGYLKYYGTSVRSLPTRPPPRMNSGFSSARNSKSVSQFSLWKIRKVSAEDGEEENESEQHIAGVFLQCWLR